MRTPNREPKNAVEYNGRHIPITFLPYSLGYIFKVPNPFPFFREVQGGTSSWTEKGIIATANPVEHWYGKPKALLRNSF